MSGFGLGWQETLPWYVNVGKRLVKSPKIYFRDSGLFHTLQGIETESALITHPKVGASWEGFALDQILSQMPDAPAYFYSIHGGAELDVYFPNSGLGVEVKRQDAPRHTRSMDIAMRDINLQKLIVVYPRSRAFSIADRIRAVPLSEITHTI